MGDVDLLHHAVSVLQAFDIEPGPLDRLLRTYWRRHPELSGRSRRAIASAVYGVMRWRPRLDGALVLQGWPRPDHAARILCYLLWQRPEEASAMSYEWLAAARGVAEPMPEEMPRRFPGGAGAFAGMPPWLFDLLQKAHGSEEARALALALNEQARPVLRVNTLKSDREGVERNLAAEGMAPERTACSPWGLVLPRRVAMEKMEAYRRGLVEIQDEASQLAVAAAASAPGERVLDLCAGAGGKSLAMAMLMQNAGNIVASDVEPRKLKELSRRALRAGASIIQPLAAALLSRRQDLRGVFDLVLVDAPCSGTGTLRRNPDLKWRLSPALLAESVALQKKLLERAAGWARAGGRIAYVTCSLLPQENEEVASWAISSLRLSLCDPRAALIRAGAPPDNLVTDEGYFKTDPRRGGWDGFFAAVFFKKG